jgi:hypothetical protein
MKRFGHVNWQYDPDYQSSYYIHDFYYTFRS